MSRITRSEFAIKYILSTATIIIITYLVSFVNYGFANSWQLIFLILFLLQLIYLIPNIIKRSRDAELNIFLSLLLTIIPIINIFFIFYLFYVPSTEVSIKIREEEKKIKEWQDLEKAKELIIRNRREKIFGYIFYAVIMLFCILFWEEIGIFLDSI